VTVAELTAPEDFQLLLILQDLHDQGYRDIEQHDGLRVGTRVRHRGEQYPEAFRDGTGVVIALTERPDSSWSLSWGMPDVELVVLRDTPRFDGQSRLSWVAQYHVSAVEEQLCG
jgi:hypothetical protein